MARRTKRPRTEAAPETGDREASRRSGMAEAKSLHEAGRFAEAAALYERLIDAPARRAKALRLIAIDAGRKGDVGLAVGLLERAVRADPANAPAHVDLAHGLGLAGSADDAAAALRRAIELDPASVEAWTNLGAMLVKLGRLEEARSSFQAALGLDPAAAMARRNLGAVLNLLDDPDSAEAELQKALERGPADAQLHVELAIARRDRGRIDEAVAACRAALEIAPNDARAHVLFAHLLLLAGRYREGFAEYEWRNRLPEHRSSTGARGVPPWTGGSLSGKTVLLWAEQGYGDTLQFCRYAPLMKAKGGRVVLAVPAVLVELCRSLDGIDAVTGDGPVPGSDTQVSLAGLPRLFGTTPAAVPARVPYLRAPSDRAAAWRRRMSDRAGFRLGIAWQGNPKGPADRGRSIPLARLVRLGRIPTVRLISLQKGFGQEQLAAAPPDLAIEDAGSGCESFADTAAVIENLDLVVASDTALAHLAGALGRPAWVALKRVPAWRWGLEGESSPWYPTMRLFRQKTPGDWEGVMDDMAGELGRLVSAGGGRPPE